MNNKINNPKKSDKLPTLTLVCSLVYFASYLTRYNFSAALVEIISSEGFTKAEASMSTTGLFVTYGLGQLFSGWLGDKISPNRLMFLGLVISSAMNFAVPFAHNPYLMLVLWCINGFAQALIWPPLVKILSSYLDGTQYKKASFYVNCASSFGTVSVYLLTPLFIRVASWRAMFIFSATATVVIAVVWMIVYRRKITKYPFETVSTAENNAEDTAKAESKAVEGKTVTVFFFAFILFAIVMQGILRDGVTTWMPTLIKEAFGKTNTVSILISVVLPIFSIISFRIAGALNTYYAKDEIKTAAILFSLSTISLLGLFATGMKILWLTVALLCIATGCAYGVNFMLISLLPAKFKRSGKVSFVSGLLNTATYVGSAVSIYGVALLTDVKGWSFTVLIWGVVALCGCVACVFGKKLFDKMR